MKKKLLEKDGFYLALFACVCLVAVGGVWFTKNNVDDLASNNLIVNDTDNDDEVHLIEKENEETVPTSTESEQNLEQAKKEQVVNKLSFLGQEVVREYSEKTPSYSKTLDVWEIHKGLDVSAKKGSEVKSLLSGKVTKVFNDDENGMSVEVTTGDTVVVYSNLDAKVSVEKEQTVKEGQVLGKVGNTTSVELEDGEHVHIEAYRGEESINPMSLIK